LLGICYQTHATGARKPIGAADLTDVAGRATIDGMPATSRPVLNHLAEHKGKVRLMAYASLMGARVKRKEDPRLITGTATYVGDLKLPGMHYVAFVRSPYAHARVGVIDTAAALAIPGVVAVVTGQDLQEAYEPMPMADPAEIPSEEANEQSKRLTHYALSVDRVRHIGEAVAAVIATSPAIAADGASEVEVDWEPLPAVADPLTSIGPDAPRLFDGTSSNIEHTWRRKTGDTDAAFASAHRVVKQRMVSQRLSGVPMEGRAVVAAPDGTTGGLNVWSSTQAPHLLRGNLAEALRVPENLVRVVAPEVGGGFGVKIFTYAEEIAVAALARRHGMPLSWSETRVEHMATTMHGRAQIADLEAAVAEDGTITALRMHVVADIGAYPVAPDIPESTGIMAVGVYAIPAVDIEIQCVFTNTTPVAAYRGAGRPEPAYYIERLVDIIAAELDLDPVEVRRRNFIPPEAFPYKTPTGKFYDSGAYDTALAKALEIADYSALRAEQRRRGEQGDDRLLGIGLSCYVEICGFGYESAIVRVEPTGTVTVFTGISPHGQGQETTFAQIVADQLGCDYDKVVVRHGDTRETPMGQGTMGSRGLAVGGSALLRAADKVRDKARRVAGLMLEAAHEDIVLSNGRYHVQGVPDQGYTLAEIADRAYSDNFPDDLEPGLEETAFFRLPPSTNTCPFGAHVAVVEIERETGVVHVRDYYAVDDCGPRISPVLAEGQIHGGLAQGIAQALWEEVVFDDQGQLLTGSLMDYAVPRASFFPPFTLAQTETPTPLNPLGVKGIGEAATIGSTPAVANAVLDALRTAGVRHLDLPLSAEKVWRAIAGLGER
jgi:aerobic carbon-monoxide dehydrogenase large subunit